MWDQRGFADIAEEEERCEVKHRVVVLKVPLHMATR